MSETSAEEEVHQQPPDYRERHGVLDFIIPTITSNRLVWLVPLGLVGAVALSALAAFYGTSVEESKLDNTLFSTLVAFAARLIDVLWQLVSRFIGIIALVWLALAVYTAYPWWWKWRHQFITVNAASGRIIVDEEVPLWFKLFFGVEGSSADSYQLSSSSLNTRQTLVQQIFRSNTMSLPEGNVIGNVKHIERIEAIIEWRSWVEGQLDYQMQQRQAEAAEATAQATQAQAQAVIDQARDTRELLELARAHLRPRADTTEDFGEIFEAEVIEDDSEPNHHPK